MEPVSNEVLQAIETLASSSREAFPVAYSEWLGRKATFGSMKLCHHLFIQTVAEEGVKQKLIGQLKVIKGYSKAYQYKPLVQEVKEALQLLTQSVGSKRATIQTQFSDEVIDQVGIENALIQGLEDALTIQYGCLSFTSNVADKLDDATLELILKKKSIELDKVFKFDFSLYPMLSVRAPALIRTYCPRIDRSWYRAVFKDPRFLDFTVVVNDTRVQVNKAFLFLQSGYCAKLLGCPVGADLRSATEIAISFEDEEKEVADWFVDMLSMNPRVDSSLETALKSITWADYFECKDLKESSITCSRLFANSYKNIATLHTFFQERSHISQEEAKTQKEILAARVVELLERPGKTVSANAPSGTFTPHQLDELKCYFVNEELRKMKEVDNLPLPKDLRAKLTAGIVGTEPCYNLQKLLATLDILEGNEPSRDAVVDETPSHPKPLERSNAQLEGGFLYALFLERVKAKIKAINIDCTEEQTNYLAMYFALQEMKSQDAAMLPVLITELKLYEQVKAACSKLQRFPQLLSDLISELYQVIKTDAMLPCLLGELHACSWGDKGRSYSRAKQYFAEALAIDPQSQEAIRGLAAFSFHVRAFGDDALDDFFRQGLL